MEWTATLLESVPNGANQITEVLIVSDAGDKSLQKYLNNGTVADVKRQVLATIAGMEAREPVKSEFKSGMALDLTPIAPDPPDPSIEAAVAFQRAYWLYQSMLRGVELGVVTDKDLDTQRALVQAAYLPEYVGRL